MDESLRLDGMVIDPGSSEVIFGHEMLKMIYDQMNSPTDVKVGDPDHYPENLKTAIVSFMKDEPSVKAVYVKLFVRLSDEMTGWMFVMDADKKGALLTELHVALPNSSLIADTLRAEYQFKDDEIIPQSVKFDGCITESHIYPGDLAPIVPQLREFNNSLSLSSRFSGTPSRTARYSL